MRTLSTHSCAQHYKPLVVEPRATSTRSAWLRVTERTPSSCPLCAPAHAHNNQSPTGCVRTPQRDSNPFNFFQVGCSSCSLHLSALPVTELLINFWPLLGTPPTLFRTLGSLPRRRVWPSPGPLHKTRRAPSEAKTRRRVEG